MQSNANFASALEAACRAHARRTALHHLGERVSYAALADLIDGWTGVLAGSGVAEGAVVALWLPNSPAFVAAYFAALRRGGIAAPLGILLRPGEVMHRLSLVDPAVVVTTAELAALLPESSTPVLVAAPHGRVEKEAARAAPASRAEDDVAVIIFSSGTTGAAKAVELTHRGMEWNARGLAQGFALGPDDVQLGVAPFSHVLGMTGIMNASLLGGASIALQDRFDVVSSLALMSHAGVTVAAGAPAMFVALARGLHASGAAHPLRFIHAGGATFPEQAERLVSEAFGCAVHAGYGMSEVGGAISLEPSDGGTKPRAVGRALPGSELRVVDVASGVPAPRGQRGEIQVKSPSVMRGYRGDVAATRAVLSADGWLSTGDIGYLDSDGDLCLVDRRKEIIIRSGYNVYPAEVEQVLLSHPGVVEAAVVGVPHDDHGEEVVALVVVTGEAADPEAIKAFAKERLAAYKYPRHVLPVPALPKGATGKVAKREIDRDELLRLIRARGAARP